MSSKFTYWQKGDVLQEKDFLIYTSHAGKYTGNNFLAFQESLDDVKNPGTNFF